MRTENVSLSWLLGAAVAPFLRNRTTSDAETARALRMHLEDEAWSVALFTDGFSTAWLLHQPGALVHDKGEIRYRMVTVIAGPSGEETESTLASLGHAVLQHVQRISTTQLEAIAHGLIGTWRLFGDEKTPGLWNPADAATGITLRDAQPPGARAVAEDTQLYQAMPAPARAIVDAWDHLAPDRRSALVLVVSGLVTPLPSETAD